jgi:hypothetical protein
MTASKSKRDPDQASVPQSDLVSGFRAVKTVRLPLQSLQEIICALATVRSVVIFVSNAPDLQKADAEADAALVLRQCAADEIGRQIDRLESWIETEA